MQLKSYLAIHQSLLEPFNHLDGIEKKVYDPRDLARLQTEDAYTLRFVYHQQFDIKKAAAQVDASLRFRKEFAINGTTAFDAARKKNRQRFSQIKQKYILAFCYGFVLKMLNSKRIFISVS